MPQQSAFLIICSELLLQSWLKSLSDGSTRQIGTFHCWCDPFSKCCAAHWLEITKPLALRRYLILYSGKVFNIMWSALVMTKIVYVTWAKLMLCGYRRKIWDMQVNRNGVPTGLWNHRFYEMGVLCISKKPFSWDIEPKWLIVHILWRTVPLEQCGVKHLAQKYKSFMNCTLQVWASIV